MIRTHPQRPARRANIVPLTAILLIPLLALAAFAVDLGYVVLIQSDLQNAADAAALAGASKLTDGFVKYNLPGQSSSAQASILSTAEANASAAAKQFAGLNNAGVTGLTLLDSDIEYGFTDASGNYTANSASSATFPNTIKVSLRRDGTANTSLGLFFGPVCGKSTQDLKATAAAAIYEVNINGFQNTSTPGFGNTGGLHVGMLPMTYDVNAWNNFLQTGANPDGGISTDSNGVPDISVYPSVKDTGNFGLLGLDDAHAGTSEVNGWIASGLTQTELNGVLNPSPTPQTPLLPLSAHNSTILPSASTDGMGSWNWVGDTGMKTDVLHTLGNYQGTSFLLPLFKPLNDGTSGSYAAGNGNGSHYYYNIVQFVSVKIIYVDNKSLVVEPSATVVNPSQVTFQSPPVPAGSGGSSSRHTFTFTPPKLTQ